MHNLMIGNLIVFEILIFKIILTYFYIQKYNKINVITVDWILLNIYSVIWDFFQNEKKRNAK
jgi:hypothetical protein